MKKFFALALSGMMLLALAACGDSGSSSSEAAEPVTSETGDTSSIETTDADLAEAPAFVSITTFNGNKEAVEIEVPYDAQRLAVMDLGVLDILDNIGVGDRIVAVSKGSSIDYLQSYVSDESLLDLGTIKEADLEAVMEAEPDVIFIGGRLSSYYDELSAIAPVVYLSTDVEKGVVASTEENATAIASIFGLEEKVSTLMAEYADRISALQELSTGKTAIVSMVNAGGLGILGNDGRCSIIGVEIGFENVGIDADIDTSTHGNDASFEFLVDVDPDYVFIMDRDAAINTEGAQLAAEVMDNELVHMTQADQNGNIIILDNPNVWYTAEGGITALGIMLADLEAGLVG